MSQVGSNNHATKKERKGFQHWQVIAIYLAVFDVVAANFSYFFALLVRFDFRFSNIPIGYLHGWMKAAPVYTVVCIAVFYALRLYHSLWRFASYSELYRVGIACGITTVVQIVGTLLLVMRMPISYYVVGAIMQFIFVLGIRFSYRFILLLRGRNNHFDSDADIDNVMIVGAGNAGQMLLRDFRRAKEVREKVACFIDDNPNKWGRYIDGVEVAGGRDDIFKAVRKYHIRKIYLAIPSATAVERRDILNICKDTGCKLKVLPGMYQLATGQISVGQTRNVSVEDLLGREPIKADLSGVFNFVHGKSVIITGAGGSIGSELSRQIASHNPKQLILLDFYENNVYDVQLELKDKYPELDLVVLIASVRDSRRMFEIFEKYHPQIVYHAAAHKHVPLMEDSPCEAIKNNAIGTYKTAYAALVYGCKRFVLISTDKAVNPT
ncbi:MAG: polysaccharide biosynthesis protein, partial [Lachnospiraceae bacterium]|nr:polysaccharide biosynthesis protein [Lachnospiraceae bacterium]